MLLNMKNVLQRTTKQLTCSARDILQDFSLLCVFNYLSFLCQLGVGCYTPLMGQTVTNRSPSKKLLLDRSEKQCASDRNSAQFILYRLYLNFTFPRSKTGFNYATVRSVVFFIYLRCQVFLQLYLCHFITVFLLILLTHANRFVCMCSVSGAVSEYVIFAFALRCLHGPKNHCTYFGEFIC